MKSKRFIHPNNFLKGFFNMAPLETVAKNCHITYKYGFLKMNDFEKLYLKVSCQ